jgi:hypothetical protein
VRGRRRSAAGLQGRALRPQAVDALCEPDFPASGHVVFFDRSRFEFVADADGGEAFEAMLLLALNEFGEVCDIVA